MPLFFTVKNSVKNIFHMPMALFVKGHQDLILSKDYPFLLEWLEKNAHGDMKYLEKNLEARQNFEKIMGSFQTGLTFLFPYAPGKRVRTRIQKDNISLEPNQDISSKIPKETDIINKNSLVQKRLISKYVHVKDYHKSIKKYLEQCVQTLQKQLGIEFEYRVVVDSIPFFDRAYARESGLGFIGKNTMLIRPGMGSYFFIGSLLTSLPIETLCEEKSPQKSTPPIYSLNCGSCTKCLDSCPTNAIEQPYFVNAKKCLSYLTIEHRDIVDPSFLPHFANTIYGCDICQDVCPYNLVTTDFPLIKDFANPHPYFLSISVYDIATMTKESYEKWFGGTAATRAKYGGLVRNALYHLYATNSPQLADVLKLWKGREDSSEPLILKTVHQIVSLLSH
jgi:epoxyqueuosine reductase